MLRPNPVTTGPDKKPLSVFELMIEKKKCIVLGNGISINDFEPVKGVFTIGVNDICRKFTPNILLLVDEKSRFKSKERIDMIEASDCIHVVSDNAWHFSKGRTYKFNIGGRGSFRHFDDKNTIDSGWDSPYMAVMLAAKLGFKDIDVIGVDYCDNHFYAEDGAHNLMPRLQEVDEYYKKLVEFLSSKGVKVHNISSVSKLKNIPFYNKKI